MKDKVISTVAGYAMMVMMGVVNISNAHPNAACNLVSSHQVVAAVSQAPQQFSNAKIAGYLRNSITMYVSFTMTSLCCLTCDS
jgi:hypothetical protein